ncbi:MAG: phospho-N-acetylmuramoyl-pentapeptide-transferase [Bacteroidales bacterium]|nr:phospho-N-acetylmuramoyl-pentapeptide-transferase [Bacteroidales bacterium]
MLYHFFTALEDYGITWARLWHYTSFRSLLAFMLALIVSAWFGQYFIKWMRKRKIYEQQRSEDIDPFGVDKRGIPSMGGIIIIVAILLPALLLGKLDNVYMLLMIGTTLWLGLLGFLDDYIKIFRRNKDGLKGRFKIVGQVSIGLVVGLTLYLSPQATIHENIEIERGAERHVVHKTEASKSTLTTIPFVKSNNLDYAELVSFLGEYKRAAGWVVFVLVSIFIVTALSNGTNLNDGMDGMAAGNSAIVGLALMIFAYVSSHIEFAHYLNIMYIPHAHELVVFTSAFVGALLGFLWYNAYPAQIFMGDTGSLAIGGIIGVLALITHKELLLPVLCFIFLVESVSVLLQTSYFKWGKRRGRVQRVFKRAPIHDSFRTLASQLDPQCKYLIKWPRGAWHESKITVRFWITTMLLAALTIITLKLR